MRRCVRCNAPIVLGDLCATCEHEYKRRAADLLADFKRERKGRTISVRTHFDKALKALRKEIS